MARLMVTDYCDCKASKAHTLSYSDPNGELLPAEKWALFSSYPTTRKITGKISKGIMQSLHTDDIIAYISKKHSMTEDKLYHVDTTGLQNYLKSLPPPQPGISSKAHASMDTYK